MAQADDTRDEKPEYEPPKILATYAKEDLEKVLRPAGGCGCGCGGS
jgi:hypothetical protein